MTKMQITQPGSRHPQCILAMSPVRPRSHFPRAIRGCPALGNSTNVQKVGPSAASRVQPHRGQHSGRTTPPSSPPADKQYLQTLVRRCGTHLCLGPSSIPSTGWGVFARGTPRSALSSSTIVGLAGPRSATAAPVP